MNKKIFSLCLITFLSIILFVSCSNKDKTGSSTGGIEISKYKGSWKFFDGTFTREILTIKADGSCDINGDKAFSVVKKADNIYLLIFKLYDGNGNLSVIDMNITFTSENTGTVLGIQKDILADGTIETREIKNKIERINS